VENSKMSESCKPVMELCNYSTGLAA